MALVKTQCILWFSSWCLCPKMHSHDLRMQGCHKSSICEKSCARDAVKPSTTERHRPVILANLVRHPLCLNSQDPPCRIKEIQTIIRKSVSKNPQSEILEILIWTDIRSSACVHSSFNRNGVNNASPVTVTVSVPQSWSWSTMSHQREQGLLYEWLLPIVGPRENSTSGRPVFSAQGHYQTLLAWGWKNF